MRKRGPDLRARWYRPRLRRVVLGSDVEDDQVLSRYKNGDVRRFTRRGPTQNCVPISASADRSLAFTHFDLQLRSRHSQFGSGLHSGYVDNAQQKNACQVVVSGSNKLTSHRIGPDCD